MGGNHMLGGIIGGGLQPQNLIGQAAKTLTDPKELATTALGVAVPPIGIANTALKLLGGGGGGGAGGLLNAIF
jgi:hypothetical protein